VSGEGRAERASPPARVVFFGSGTFGVPILGSLRTLPAIDLAGVITLLDRPAGRRATLTPTPVAVAAGAAGVAVLKVGSVRTPASLERISALRPDLGVLADFGRIVPAELLALPAQGILNVHPSLLPRHRGATPVPATILADDDAAGVSVILMDEGLDTGPVLDAESWPLTGDETAPELEARAAAVGASMVRRLVPAWLAGAVVPVPQPATGATLTRPFRREDGRLDPSRPAVQLERMVRALQPWPGTFVESAAGRLSILEATVAASEPGGEPGRFEADGDGLALATSEGRLRLVRVQPAGGRPMSATDFRRGAGRRLIGMRVDGGSTRAGGF
jgi:methionyl-tRNA formyltransferase